MVKFVLSLTTGQKRLVLLLLDILCVPSAFVAASIIHFSTFFPYAALAGGWPLVPLLMATALGLSLALGTSRVLLGQYGLAAVILTVQFAATMAVVSAALSALGGLAIPAGFHAGFGLMFFAFAAGARMMLLHLLVEFYRQSAAITRVLIYGAGRTGMTLARVLSNRPDILPLAFIDDNVTLRGLDLAGLPVHSGVDIERIMAKGRVDRVILAMPSLSPAKQSRLTQRLERLGLEVLALPAFAQVIGDRDLAATLQPARPNAPFGRPPVGAEADGAAEAYRGQSVMITGAGGSIGLELCRQVVGCAPARMVLVELSELALYNAEREMRALADGTGTEIIAVLGSVADPALVRRAIGDNGVEVILHAAAYKHVSLVEANPRAGMTNNALGTATVAQAAAEAGVERFVLVSTDKAVRPQGTMGASKRIAELVVQDLATRSRRTRFAIVRFGNVIGSSGSVIPLFQEQIARGGPVTLTDPEATRYFMTTQEAAWLVLVAGGIAEGGEVFVLDMGAPVRIGELARRLIENSGYRVRDAATPDGDIEIVTVGLRPGEKLHEELTIRPGAELTAHPKIISVREDHLSELETAALLRDLREAVQSEDGRQLGQVLDRWVGGMGRRAIAAE